MSDRLNLATSTVSAAPSPATSGTAVAVQTGHGVRFPAPQFYATLHPDGSLPTLDNAEIVLVTAVSTDTFTITRHQKGTTAQSVAIGWRMSQAIYDEDTPWPGTVTAYAAASAPTGWLLCNGASLLRTDYPALFAIIGTTFGTVDGTHFNVPDLQGKVPVGKNGATFSALAGTGGEETHVLTSAESAAHTHAVDPPNTVTDTQGSHSHTYLLPPDWAFLRGTTVTNTVSDVSSNSTLSHTTSTDGAHAHNVDIASFTSGSSGSGGAHNNLQPYVVLNYIIKT